jgi:capsular exopolysaccharide synthesis family protein
MEQVLQALSAQFQAPCAAPEPLLESGELVMLSHPQSAQAEALRGIRGQLQRRLARLGGAPGALAVLSPEPGDGKTFLVANLGIAFAQTGARTLIVDADMRGPRMHEVFRLGGRHGLSSALIGRSEGQPIQAVPATPGLYVLPCGITPPNPIELLERESFRTLLRTLPQHFDRVLVDTPAVAYGADAFAIADRCGASLLVGRRNRSGIGALRRVADELSQDAGRLAGMIVNDF